jgi:magnesium transporter
MCSRYRSIGSFEGNVKLSVLKENINDIHPVDLADILEELEGSQRMAVFNELEPELASDTLEEVEPRVQRELIRSMEKEKAAGLINDMSPAQVAGILSVLPASEADEIIDQNDENIMLYSTQQVIKRPATTMVKEVVDNFREVAIDMDVIMYVYVVDADNVLQGVVDIRELIAAAPEQTLGDIMTDSLITLNPDDTLHDAVDMFFRYSFRAIPISDAEDHLLGVVSCHDIRGVKPRLD